MTTIRGHEAHKRRLRKLRGAAMVRPVTQAIFASAQDLAVDASLSITKGSVSGKGHVASAAGTPPNNDTGVLARNIEAVSTGPLKAETSSNAPYAAIQEFGGTIKHPGGTPYFIGSDGKPRFVSKFGAGAFHGLPTTKPHDITLPERPYMRPAAKRERPKAVKRVVDAVNKVIRNSGAK